MFEVSNPVKIDRMAEMNASFAKNNPPPLITGHFEENRTIRLLQLHALPTLCPSSGLVRSGHLAN